MPPIFAPLVTFAKNNPALTMVLASGLLSAGPAEPGMTSVIVHIINLGFLFGMRYSARDSKFNMVTGVLFLLSLGFTMVQDRFMVWSYIIQIMNAFLILYLWWYVSTTEKITTPSGDLND